MDSVLKNLTQPVLGICLGMQLLCKFSDKNNTDCLNILPYRVRLFESENLKIPQTGWNNIYNLKTDLLKGVKENPSEDSHTSKLFAKGINKIAQKVGEEAVELFIEAKDDNDKLFKAEAADLMFHFLRFAGKKKCLAGGRFASFEQSPKIIVMIKLPALDLDGTLLSFKKLEAQNN